VFDTEGTKAGVPSSCLPRPVCLVRCQPRFLSQRDIIKRPSGVRPVGGHTRYEICHVVWTPEDLEDFEILAEHVESLGKVPLVFALTTHGMAMGPVSSTVYVGLDLAAGSKADS